MIYDRTTTTTTPPRHDLPQGLRGFALHAEVRDGATIYTLFTDDGRGNGDYVCESGDRFWIDRIAAALDDAYGEASADLTDEARVQYATNPSVMHHGPKLRIGSLQAHPRPWVLEAPAEGETIWTVQDAVGNDVARCGDEQTAQRLINERGR